MRRLSCGTWQCIGLGVILLTSFGLLSCSGASTGSQNSTPTVTLSASAKSITDGQSVTLTWQSTDATSVIITAVAGSSTRTVATSSKASGSISDSPTQTTAYTAVATGAGGKSSPETVTVQVAQPAAPQVTEFKANPTSITSGQATTLTWTTSNATSITITATAGTSTRTVTTSSEASGTISDSPSQTTTYTAVASGAGGKSAPQTATVQVAAVAVPQITSFTANPTSITTGLATTLSWTTTNATSVTITATAGGSKRTVATLPQGAGSTTDSPTQTTTYTATATGAGGTSAPATATVTVTAPVPPQITQFTANPTTVTSGQTTTLTWATTNATSVTITPSISGDDTGLSASGSAVTPVSTTTTFSLTATGPGGTAGPQTVTVTVPITLTFTASPTTITTGGSSTLAWQVSGGTASSLTITDGSGNNVCNPCALPQGTATVTPAATTTYSANAVVNGTTLTQSATVTVNTTNSGVIKHIFFMLQENRSFDMYLGQLGSYRPGRLAQFGITDTATIDGFNPSVTLTNNNTGATVQPFHETTVCTENLTPAWDESHHDTHLLNGGDPAWATTTTFTSSSFGMDWFLDTTNNVPEQYDPNGTRALGYYNQQDLPYYYDLATFFATSDSWHSPILANTVPNRMYLMAGTSFGHEYPDNSGHPLYAAPTIFRAMNNANVSWLYYYHDGIFLANFADFNDPKIGPKTYPESDLMNTLAGNCAGTGTCDPDKALPQVIFIDSASGSSGLDEHPDNNIQSGAAYVQSIIAALMNSDAWQDSVFILSYDEGGGLYDHVAPFMVPLPDNYAPGQCPDKNNGSAGYCAVGTIGGTFDVTGFRVPVMVISPYAKPNFVSHVPRDYTAILAFIEETFGVTPLTARDASWQNPSCGNTVGCTDMNEFFDFTNPALLNPPPSSFGTTWTQVLNAQTTTGTCNQQLESGP